LSKSARATCVGDRKPTRLVAISRCEQQDSHARWFRSFNGVGHDDLSSQGTARSALQRRECEYSARAAVGRAAPKKEPPATANAPGRPTDRSGRTRQGCPSLYALPWRSRPDGDRRLFCTAIILDRNSRPSSTVRRATRPTWVRLPDFLNSPRRAFPA